MLPFYIVIPARLQSTRLPNKILLTLRGKTVLQHVWERAIETGIAPENIWIATDSEQVKDCATQFGSQVCMTSAQHRCGTDRIAEVAERMQWDDRAVVLNLQGDEPFMQPELLTRVARSLQERPDTDMATLACPCEPADIFSPHSVKVVCARNMRALYFSRAPIPWDRACFVQNKIATTQGWLRHVGLYAYRVKTFARLQQDTGCFLEQTESLEQLRALWLGLSIHVEQTDTAPIRGIDTQEDWEFAQSLVMSNG